MRSLGKLLSAKSPQSVKDIDDEEEFIPTFSNPNEPIFSVLQPSHHPSKQRIRYLWKRTRILMRALTQLIRVWKNIQRYGALRNQYSLNIARHESTDLVSTARNTTYLFYQEGSFLKVWSLVILALLAYNASIVPFVLCFYDVLELKWYILENCSDIIFFLDIGVTFNSAYYDDEMKLIQNRTIISLNYLKSWFFLDLVACFPVQLFLSDNQSYNKLARISRISRAYKLLRFLKLLKLVRIIKSAMIFQNLLEKLRMTAGFLCLLRFILTILLLVHVAGCVWYLIARLDDSASQSWLQRYDLVNVNEVDLYIASVYYVTQIITTIGFGDIVPVTISERIYSLALMFIGICTYSYIVGSLSTIVQTADSEANSKRIMIGRLKEFAQATNLPDKLKESIKVNIERVTRSGYSREDKEELLKELPTSLQREVEYHMHKKIVEKIFFFQDKDLNFISNLVAKLKTIEHLSGKFVYKQGDTAEEVFFLSKGRVTLLAESGVVLKNYLQGCYFGELEILANNLRQHTVQVASLRATLLTIYKRDFLLVMKQYPDVFTEVKATAKIRELKNAEAISKLLKSLAVQKNRYDKAKTLNEGQEMNIKKLQPFGVHQGWKHFVKHSLGIKPNPPIDVEAPGSVWDEYARYKRNNDPNKRFMSKNAVTEIIERAECPSLNGTNHELCRLRKQNFSGIILKQRISEKRSTEKLETESFSSVLIDNSVEEEEEGISLGSILTELRSIEKIAEEKYEKLSNTLELMFEKQIEAKNKLEKFLTEKQSLY